MSPKKMLFLVPGRLADGTVMRIKEPGTKRVLSDAGEWKAESAYWLRRLRDGDVLEGVAPPLFKESEPEATEAKPKKKRGDAPKED